MSKRVVTLAMMPVFAIAQPALAEEEPFDGIAMTIIGGIDSSGTSGNAHTGVLYAGQLGFDMQANKVVYGLEAEIGDATTKACLASAAVCIRASRDLYVGGRLGITVTENTLLYAKGGYSNARQTFRYEVTVPVQPGLPESSTEDGWRIGVGVEQALGRGFHLKAEYRYSDYGSSLTRHQGVVGLGLRF
jgi:outer membrane immunogenic protein